MALQIFFKAFNDSVGANGFMAILLVFGAYPRMTKLDALSPSIIPYVMAIKKAIDEV